MAGAEYQPARYQLATSDIHQATVIILTTLVSLAVGLITYLWWKSR
jgi:hypothetical protein